MESKSPGKVGALAEEDTAVIEGESGVVQRAKPDTRQHLTGSEQARKGQQ